MVIKKVISFPFLINTEIFIQARDLERGSLPRFTYRLLQDGPLLADGISKQSKIYKVFFSENLKERNRLSDLGTDGRTILEQNLEWTVGVKLIV